MAGSDEEAARGVPSPKSCPLTEIEPTLPAIALVRSMVIVTGCCANASWLSASKVISDAPGRQFFPKTIADRIKNFINFSPWETADSVRCGLFIGDYSDTYKVMSCVHHCVSTSMKSQSRRRTCTHPCTLGLGCQEGPLRG